ncbi:MAG TPA: lysylphosphatidylglycerol synthase transmembrane domain-containing protein [Solirubrobacteraceae bacterium]|nr:lysylphosphatidylglycerol synthase transmembrane domain-containing protein [Solirubrobacteraceae bacterium]
MSIPEHRPARRRSRIGRRVGVLAAILLVGLVVYAFSRLDLPGIGHALITATPGWIALALLLMAASLALRSVSWHQTLRAALPDTPIAWSPVVRATMIGVMASALFPGRIGEPSRVLVLTRRLDGPTSRLLPVVGGTVFSQALINLLALAILAGVTFADVPLLHGDLAGVTAVLAVPLAIGALVLAGPRLLRLGRRSRSTRIVRTAETIARQLQLARHGLVVFARPRYGLTAITCQLLAWALQLAGLLHGRAGVGSAVPRGFGERRRDPARRERQRGSPSDSLQCRCLPGRLLGRARGLRHRRRAGLGLRHHPAGSRGLTAIGLGIPALLAEGLSWRDIRPARARTAGERAE